VRTDVTEVVVIGENLVVGLKILANPDVSAKDKVRTRWQVLSVCDGRIVEIRGYERRGEATAFAATGVSRWSS
jgi:hypothetical protein